MFKVYAYDKDGDVEIFLMSLPTHEQALFAARIYVPLVNSELLRNNHGKLDSKGEPFDWVAIEKPDGTIEPVIEFTE